MESHEVAMYRLKQAQTPAEIDAAIRAVAIALVVCERVLIGNAR